MKILIPTAKEMKERQIGYQKEPLSSLSQQVVAVMVGLSIKDLAAFYKISTERAELEYKRWQALQAGTAENYPALELFDGLMYRQMKRSQLSQEEQAYLDDHLFITSSLYGVIPARKPISAHRLDFMGSVKVAGKSLKSFWRKAYDQALAGEDLIISLLSSEFEAVFSKRIRDRLVRVKFLEERDGKLKVHSTISKKARGAFVTALLESQVKTMEQMTSLTFADFSYRKELSSPQELVFVKVSK